MAVTTQWHIVQLEVRPDEGALSDVVLVAHWRCIATDGTYSYAVYGAEILPAPSAGQFVPYADLTENEVLDWIWANGVDRAATDTAAIAGVQAQVQPPVITPPLPWEA